MKVSIIEANDPDDFYDNRLDGVATRSLLETLGVEFTYRISLDEDNFDKSLSEACNNSSDCIHLSCHGNKSGISIAGDLDLGWEKFADKFQKYTSMPTTLVMATCHGGEHELAKVFQTKTNKPIIIFGSTEALSFADYCVAWSLLYTNFSFRGVKKQGQQMRTPLAKKALRKICASVNNSFVYRRFDDSKGRYLRFPSLGDEYSITKT